MTCYPKLSSIITSVALLAGCATPTRFGTVNEPATGLQYGSVIERNIFLDSSQFRNRSVKVSTRNVSGDEAYQIAPFNDALNSAFAQKGYIPTQSDSFGIKIDINVLYSGHIQSDMSARFGFLGGAAGGVVGYRAATPAGTAAGMIVGATIGTILGSYITDDTYIVVAEVSLGISDLVDSAGGDRKVIAFSSSPRLQEEKLPSNFTPFREVIRTRIAVYGGGRNVNQQQIAATVRERLVRVVCDSI